MRRKINNPVIARTMDMIVSSAVVYLFTPQLQRALAPLQAKLNANAVNAGQKPTEIGLSSVANTMVKLVPNEAPAPNSPAIVTPSGLQPIVAVVDTMVDNPPQ